MHSPASISNGRGASGPDFVAQHGKRIEEVVQKIGKLPDPVAQNLLQECLESMLTFYGEGLAHLLEVIQRVAPEGEAVYERLLQDRAVRGLLLIHGLHPDDLPTRLDQALEKVRPYMKSHGGDVELVSLENEVARLRLHGACKGCPSSAVTMELTLRHALEEFCPDLAGLEVEGVNAPEMAEPAPADSVT